MHLSLRFEDRSSKHEDVVLRLGGSWWLCDSYYFAIDQNVLPDQEDAAKVRIVLRHLLDQWLFAIEQLPDGGTAYLPYDFSDQCTSWLACTRSAGEIALAHGWADVEGHALCPSNLGDIRKCPQGFRSDGSPVLISIEQVIASIRRSLMDLACKR